MEITGWSDYVCHSLIEQNLLNIYEPGAILGFRDTAMKKTNDYLVLTLPWWKLKVELVLFPAIFT